MSQRSNNPNDCRVWIQYVSLRLRFPKTARDTARRHAWLPSPNLNVVNTSELRRASSCLSTSTPRTLNPLNMIETWGTRVSFLTRAAFVTTCIADGCGQCGSTRVMRRPKNRMPGTSIYYRRARLAYQWPSICRRRLVWTQTILWRPAKSAKSAWPSTRWKTCCGCSKVFRSTKFRLR